MMQGKLYRKLISQESRYKEHHDRRIDATTSSRADQWVHMDWGLLALTAADCLATDSYSKRLPQKLGLYCILRWTTETLMNGKEEIHVNMFILNHLYHSQRNMRPWGSQTLHTNLIAHRSTQKSTLRLISQGILLTLNDKPQPSSLESTAKSITTGLQTTQNGWRKVRESTVNTSSSKYSTMWPMHKYVIYRKMLWIYNGWRHHWSKCYYTNVLFLLLLGQQAQATGVKLRFTITALRQNRENGKRL